MANEEVFGTCDQKTLLRRGADMARLLRGDLRFSYYGRTVGLITPECNDPDTLAALTRLQGNSNHGHVPEADAPALISALTDRGLKPIHYAKWIGKADALSRAHDTIANLAIPGGLTLLTLDGASPADLLSSLATMALECGVLPSVGSVLRGVAHRSVCLVAVDGSGAVVSCAAASEFAPKDHPILGRQAWWGMLATAPEQRGKRLALILGAHAMITLSQRHGFTEFMTGVQPGNAPSEALCDRLGLAASPYAIVGCADPTLLPGGKMTK